jgi:glycosyltransferase involved in cell wall biosynthesis
VHIVTNALEVEEEYREKIDFKNQENLNNYQPKNVFVHSLEGGSPVRFPYSQQYLGRLINLGLKVVKDHDCDIIDSCYFLPYGLAAMFVKMLTGKPLIVRHAGSDLGLLADKNFDAIILQLLKSSDFIISNEEIIKKTMRKNKISKKKLVEENFFGVNGKEFSPKLNEIDLNAEFGIKVSPKATLITYIGKYGKVKGVDELLEAISRINENFFLLLVTEGPEINSLREKISRFSSLKDKYFISGFVAPWKIPSIIKKTDCLVHLENNFSFKVHMPILPLEVFSVGTPILLSGEIFNKYRDPFGLVDEKNVFVANPKNKNQLFEKLSLIIKNKELCQAVGKKSLEILPKDHFKKIIKDNEILYQKAISFKGNYNLIYGEIARLFKNFI